MVTSETYSAFIGWERIASGPLRDLLEKVKAREDSATEMPLIFHEQTGKQVDFDLRGSSEEILRRAIPEVRSGPGRPRLGVISREVTLLPRHWDWLETQSGGASAAIRRLVEEARKRNPGEAETRAAIEATGRFMTGIAGNLPDFEEAYRALYARDRSRLERFIQNWPADVRHYVLTHAPDIPAEPTA